MGSVIENEKTKEKCQTFTPDDIVKTMLDHVITENFFEYFNLWEKVSQETA